MPRDFTSTSPVITIPDHANWDAANWTFGAWVKIDSLAAQRMVLGRDDETNRHFAFSVLANGNLRLDLYPGPTQLDSSGFTITTATWTHVAARYNAATMKVYINGVERGSTTKTSQNTINEEITIGRRITTTYIPMDGLIAEVFFIGTALNLDRITAIAKGVSPQLIAPGNLLGYWPLFGTGSPEPDYAGYGNSGVISGSTVLAGTASPPVMPFNPEAAQTINAPSQMVDNAEVYIDIQALVTEEVPVLYLDIQASGVEERTSTDSATVYIDIQNTGGECFSAFSGLFFDAEALPRWGVASNQERWFCDEDATQARWATSAYAERWFTDEDEVDVRWAVVGLSSENTGC